MRNSLLPSKWFPWPDFNEYFIGFQNLNKRLFDFSGYNDVHDKWPPFNIRNENENSYIIEMALPGFVESNIKVTLEDGILKISSLSDNNNEPSDYVYRGISQRSFKRAFALADNIEVKNAEFINGVLKINLSILDTINKQFREILVNSKSANVKAARKLLNEEYKL